jgi:hypothetical protein
MAKNFRYGLEGINKTYSSTDSYQELNRPAVSSFITTARVKKIILDDSDPKLFNEYGGWNGIGTIFWTPTNENIDKNGELKFDPSSFAKPFFPNIKHYPLLNEIVYILQLPTNNILNGDSTSNGWYYLPPLNIWSSQLHNALPETDNTANDSSQIGDYTSSFAGQVRRPEDKSTEIDLGSTFIEANSINIHPLLPYEGDIIYEGRFGNSIRFGSTVKNAHVPNEWSTEGKNGDPITIIRNGQTDYTEDSWVPKTEDVNKDISDIWLTSTQKLPITPSSNLTDSYAKSKAPDDPREYTKNQILLNSGRLVFNAKDDAIILGANKTIHLTANDSVNIDASKYISLTAPKVYLGSAQGAEGVDIQSAVLGEDLNSLLGEIAQYLSTLNTAFSSATDSLAVPIVSLLSVAAPASLALSQRLQAVTSGKNLLSTKVKVSK